MATTPRQQVALAGDANFQKRLQSLLMSEALAIANEPANTEHHEQRRQLAQAIISNPSGMTNSLAPAICNGTNLVGSTTTYNFEAFAVETAATDAEIKSQINTMWNTLAGV